MNRLSFKLKILLGFIIAAVIPFLLSWIFIYAKMNIDLKNNLLVSNNNYVQNEVNEVDAFFKQQETFLHLAADSISISAGNSNEINLLIKNQLQINKNFTNLFYIDPDGKLYGTFNGSQQAFLSFLQSQSYLEAKKKQEMVWIEPNTDMLSKSEWIGLAAPVTDSSGKDNGVLVGNIAVNSFESAIKGIRDMSDTQLLLVNSSGNIIYDSQSKYDNSIHIDDSGFILKPISNNIMYQKLGHYRFNFNNANWLCVFSNVSTNKWKIISILNESSVIAKAQLDNRDRNSYILLLGLICIFLALMASITLSTSISKPLTLLIEGVHAVSLGELDKKIEISSKDEIKELADTFNQMSGNLKSSYDALLTKTGELAENNMQLQVLNEEMEASYEQLEATMGQLNESEEKYRTMMSNISDMVIVINNEYEIVYINNRAEKLLGYDETELLGKSVKNIIKHQTLNIPYEGIFNEDFLEFQAELNKKDGSFIIAEGSTKRVMEHGCIVGVQAIARDITQRKTMENNLKSKYNELQALNRVSKAITSTLDLTSILNSIVYQIVDISSAVVCSIRLLDEKKPGKLVLRAMHGAKLELFNQEDIDIKQDAVGQCIADRKPTSVELTNENLEYDYIRCIFEEEHAKFICYHPLVAHGRMIGLLCTSLRTKPDDGLNEILTSLANSAAIAIDNAEAYNSLKQSYLKTVQSLISVVEAKDEYTESHSVRVAEYASFIAFEMGFSKKYIEDVWVAGVLHDIGKIGISDNILNKKGKLTYEEYEVVKQHPGIACRILGKIGLEDYIMDAIKHHHERYDGRGYPDGIAGSNISTMAAIIGVADAFDAITSNRPYKEAKSIEQGINEVIINKGSQFSPVIVDHFETAFLMKQGTVEKIFNDEEVEFF